VSASTSIIRTPNPYQIDVEHVEPRQHLRGCRPRVIIVINFEVARDIALFGPLLDLCWRRLRPMDSPSENS
jgi:hypothetical protein